jgi:hypothetical protein
MGAGLSQPALSSVPALIVAGRVLTDLEPVFGGELKCLMGTISQNNFPAYDNYSSLFDSADPSAAYQVPLAKKFVAVAARVFVRSGRSSSNMELLQTDTAMAPSSAGPTVNPVYCKSSLVCCNEHGVQEWPGIMSFMAEKFVTVQLDTDGPNDQNDEGNNSSPQPPIGVRCQVHIWGYEVAA